MLKFSGNLSDCKKEKYFVNHCREEKGVNPRQITKDMDVFSIPRARR